MKKLFGKLFGSTDEGSGSKADLLKKPFAELINRSGKVQYRDLVERAAVMSEKEFVTYVGVPVLVGSAIQAGVISDQSNSEVKRKRTMLFLPTLKSEAAREMASEALKHAVYPLMKSLHSDNLKKNEFSIGRLSESDIVMPDFALSEKHANILRERSNFYVQDVGSTNGTTINGVEVEAQQRALLSEGDVLGIARYEFTFLYPKRLFLKLRDIEFEQD